MSAASLDGSVANRKDEFHFIWKTPCNVRKTITAQDTELREKGIRRFRTTCVKNKLRLGE